MTIIIDNKTGNTVEFLDTMREKLRSDKHETLTDRYKFIDSVGIAEYIASKGMDISSFKMGSVYKNKDQRDGYQKHGIVFETGYTIDNGNKITLYMANSYDGMNTLQFMLGIYRFICANGLIVGDTLFSYRLRHTAVNESKLDTMIDNLVNCIPNLKQDIELMQKITLETPKIESYINNIVAFKHGENVKPLMQSFDAVRQEDKHNSVYNVYNRVQERIIKGNYVTLDTDNNYSVAREIKRLDHDIKLNQYMYDQAKNLTLSLAA